MLLRKATTKYGDSVITNYMMSWMKMQKDIILQKHHVKLSNEAINKISKGNYIFKYSGMIDGKYVYELKLNL